MRTNQQPHITKRCSRRGAGFTMIEIMFAVLIIGVLMGLLIGGVRMAMRTTKGAVDSQTVHTIEMGASQFKSLFGFQMPLVRDQDPNAPNARSAFEVAPGATPAQNRISIHSVRDANYLAFMQSPGTGASANNPLLDDRYSEKSILIYLAGQFDVELHPGNPLPIDGVAGAGLCKPLSDGSFSIPADILHPVTGNAATLRKGVTFEPLIALNSTAPKLGYDPNAPPATRNLTATVTDRNGVAIRFYRWEPGSTPPPPPGAVIPLNVPLMVGRNAADIPGYPIPAGRDLSSATNLRGATFAIVAAGPDGVFGDEALDVICQKLGVGFPTTVPEEVKVRMQAEKDNIVEVGQ